MLDAAVPHQRTRPDFVRILYLAILRVAMERSLILAATWVFVKEGLSKDAPVHQMLPLQGFVVRFNPAMLMAAKEHKSVQGVPLGPAKQDLRLDALVFSSQRHQLQHLLVQQEIVKMTA